MNPIAAMLIVISFILSFISGFIQTIQTTLKPDTPAYEIIENCKKGIDNLSHLEKTAEWISKFVYNPKK
ncbi:MAG: hypothetical protein DRP12_03230 [Candidatus Aenigmatarchaeota archaeon]|nr:MAG: hypothetical protein DRP12_03230 [Candidatus Aenigmarchaeota archaeon]